MGKRKDAQSREQLDALIKVTTARHWATEARNKASAPWTLNTNQWASLFMELADALNELTYAVEALATEPRTSKQPANIEH